MMDGNEIYKRAHFLRVPCTAGRVTRARVGDLCLSIRSRVRVRKPETDCNEMRRGDCVCRWELPQYRTFCEGL
jgi:hypothetical protein